MRLAEPNPPVDEHRVVGLRWRRLRHSERRGVGELVAGAGHEGIEGVPVGEWQMASEGLVEGGLVLIRSRGSGPSPRRSGAAAVIGCPPIRRVSGGILLSAFRPFQLEADLRGRPQDLAGGPGDQVHVVSGQPVLHVGAGDDELQHVAPQVPRAEIRKPEVECSLGQVTAGAVHDGCPGSPRRLYRRMNRSFDKGGCHLSTDAFHRCGKQRSRLREEGGGDPRSSAANYSAGVHGYAKEKGGLGDLFGSITEWGKWKHSWGGG